MKPAGSSADCGEITLGERHASMNSVTNLGNFIQLLATINTTIKVPTIHWQA
jgi:hypothetical protein